MDNPAQRRCENLCSLDGIPEGDNAFIAAGGQQAAIRIVGDSFGGQVNGRQGQQFCLAWPNPILWKRHPC